MKKIVTVTVAISAAISLLAIVVSSRGCAGDAEQGEAFVKKQIENASLIKVGDTEWGVWWKLGSPTTAPTEYSGMLGQAKSARYEYGDTTISVNYHYLSNGNYRVRSVMLSSPEGIDFLEQRNVDPLEQRFESQRIENLRQQGGQTGRFPR